MPLGSLTRWKRFPVAAAACIFVVRGMIVQIGFHEHMRLALPERYDCLVSPLPPNVLMESHNRNIPKWTDSTTTVFAVCFFTLYGVGIALFKDVPDILGDEKAGVRTAAVVFGARQVRAMCVWEICLVTLIHHQSCLRLWI